MIDIQRDRDGEGGKEHHAARTSFEAIAIAILLNVILPAATLLGGLAGLSLVGSFFVFTVKFLWWHITRPVGIAP